MKVPPFTALPDERLGSLIRRRRRELGMTQKQLAAAIEVSMGTIHLWEWGEFLPRETSCEKLNFVLQIPEEELFTAYNVSECQRFRLHRVQALCGTKGGISAHIYRGEKLCEVCLDESRRYQREKHGWKPFKPAECGTTGGYRKHYRNGEKPCAACLEARRRYQREKYGWKPFKSPECGTIGGYRRHLREEGAPVQCTSCLRASAEDARERRKKAQSIKYAVPRFQLRS